MERGKRSKKKGKEEARRKHERKGREGKREVKEEGREGGRGGQWRKLKGNKPTGKSLRWQMLIWVNGLGPACEELGL